MQQSEGALYLTQIADWYGVHRHTFYQDLYKKAKCLAALKSTGWKAGDKFYPTQQKIIIKHFGQPIQKNSDE